ncbi:sensor domain-containing diguanylate cyclase [Blastococcus sp. CT_GayMR16]|uniref:sensor domain-containing diguanylate cyclase n=1 Tax=Blastococcus sp. CT_GayMR16 TaxID=2559607 RepID=UPI0010741B73|nr:sensor domain-containing diguanylate cyclase [Blastococcus sp. CT_GayMR16]TFV86792.1 sensor domain-containing diguanylate cyclase [Blastococcus sp. CT_GayMR16]
MHADRRTPVVLLAVLYTVSGGLCLTAAIWPLHPDSPVGLFLATGVLTLSCGAAFWVLGVRTRWGAIHAAIGFGSVLAGLLAWRSMTAVGIVGLGPALIGIGLYAATFFPLGAARLHVLALVTLATAGAIAAEPGGFPVPWVTLVVVTIALTEAQGRLARNLRTAATTDPLTGVANRRAWEAEAARNLARAVRTGDPLSFAILDLDHFKVVNDRGGHSAGDALLCELAACWSGRLRRADLLGRYGGDEFVLCLPATDEDGAWEILRQLEETHEFAWSVGLATVRKDDTLSTVLARADASLYLQKRTRTA